jgi:hypothetical protein
VQAAFAQPGTFGNARGWLVLRRPVDRQAKGAFAGLSEPVCRLHLEGHKMK